MAGPVDDHYEKLLAGVYSWSAGGAEAALNAMSAWLPALRLPAAPATVLDLGCGFGAAAIALARLGHRVTAVDSSAALLDEARALAGASPEVSWHQGDLVAAVRDRVEPVDILLCLGDTLTHLGSRDEVAALLRETARVLAPGGVGVLTWRELVARQGAERFLLVRADERRTMTCFLEDDGPDRIRVWDIVHEGGKMHVSGYPKLRLDAGWVTEAAERAGPRVERAASYRGMVTLVLRV